MIHIFVLGIFIIILRYNALCASLRTNGGRVAFVPGNTQVASNKSLTEKVFRGYFTGNRVCRIFKFFINFIKLFAVVQKYWFQIQDESNNNYPIIKLRQTGHAVVLVKVGLSCGRISGDELAFKLSNALVQNFYSWLSEKRNSFLFAVAKNYGFQPVDESDKNHAVALAKAGLSYGGISRDTTAFKPSSASFKIVTPYPFVLSGARSALYRSLMIVSFIFIPLHAQEVEHINVSAQSHARMNIELMLINSTAELDTVASYITKALEFSDQFIVTKKAIAKLPSKKEIVQKWNNTIPYVIFLEQKGNDFYWRLYDTYQATMIAGKKIVKQGTVLRGWAYALADSIWHELTGLPGMFSTKLAYCKEIPHGKKSYKHIYMADYDGSHSQPLVTTPTVNVAPRWNKDSDRPLLFYSENTNKNMRMMAVDMDRKKIMASNFDGLNMQPTFSQDGHSVVYCASRGNGNTQLYYWHDHTIKRVTTNEGSNIFPCLAADGITLFYCSDFKTKCPQVYEYNLKEGALKQITESGFCVSPTYCERTNMLAYCKMVSGKMQLFTYNRATNEHTQLTYDAASKEECMWSPCGTYLLCEVKNGQKSKIAMYNTITRAYKNLAGLEELCSYPAWSSQYRVFPA